MAKKIKPEITIRPLRVSDISDLLRMNAKFNGDKVFKNDEVFFKKNCIGPQKLAEVLIAADKLQPIGFLHSYDWISFGGRAKIRHVASLFEEPSYRKNGIGKMLIERSQRDGKKVGCKRLDIFAYKKEKVANAFYKAIKMEKYSISNNAYRKFL